MRRLVPLAVLALLSAPLHVRGGGRGGAHHSSGSSHSSSHSHSHTSASHHSSSHHSSSTTHSSGGTVQRDSHGKIKRSQAAKDAFKRSHPCPSTGKSSGACPGYVIDHVKPLKRGGADDPSNMQWQTTAEAKAKDKWE
jgi:hypothetical protein